MVEVMNWQLNRMMTYPYEEARPLDRLRRFYTNKCIGCQTCTMACKTCWTSGHGQEYMLWNNVETKPWGSYPWHGMFANLNCGPQHWDKTYGGKTILEAAPEGRKNIGWQPTD